MYTAIFKKPSGSSQAQSIKPRSGQASELRIILLLRILRIYYPNRSSTYHLGSLYIPISVVLYKTLLIINQYRLNRYKGKGCTHAS